MIRVRNPWGDEHEWQGRFSDRQGMNTTFPSGQGPIIIYDQRGDGGFDPGDW